MVLCWSILNALQTLCEPLVAPQWDATQRCFLAVRQQSLESLLPPQAMWLSFTRYPPWASMAGAECAVVLIHRPVATKCLCLPLRRALHGRSLCAHATSELSVLASTKAQKNMSKCYRRRLLSDQALLGPMWRCCRKCSSNLDTCTHPLFAVSKVSTAHALPLL